MKTPKEEFCCQVLPEILNKFSWMKGEFGGEEKLLMPHLDTYGSIRYRINHCPSCGAEIRDIKIKVEDLE